MGNAGIASDVMSGAREGPNWRCLDRGLMSSDPSMTAGESTSDVVLTLRLAGSADMCLLVLRQVKAFMSSESRTEWRVSWELLERR